MPHLFDSFPVPQPLVELKSLTIPWPMWSGMDLFHGLVVLTEAPDVISDFPGRELLRSVLKRQKATLDQLQNKPFFGMTLEGVQLAWVWIKPDARAFEIQTLLRLGLAGLLEEQPEKLVLSLWGSRSEELAGQVLYVAWVNTQELPQHKKTASSELFVGDFWFFSLEFYLYQALPEGNGRTFCRMHQRHLVAVQRVGGR